LAEPQVRGAGEPVLADLVTAKQFADVGCGVGAFPFVADPVECGVRVVDVAEAARSAATMQVSRSAAVPVRA
jgi:hypothetical protein